LCAFFSIKILEFCGGKIRKCQERGPIREKNRKFKPSHLKGNSKLRNFRIILKIITIPAIISTRKEKKEKKY
jgi:hypothetical protein